MPRTQYSKSRRILMQGTLCIIFGGSVALAAYVTHVHRGSFNARLAHMIYSGPVGVQLPRGWILIPVNQEAIRFVASEPDSPRKKGRKIIIRSQKLAAMVSSEEFLQLSGLLTVADRPITPDGEATNVAVPITIAGDSGVMLTVIRPVGGFLGFGAVGAEKVILAASVRPSGLAISLELHCPEESTAADDELILNDIATAMNVRDSGSGGK